MEIFGNSERERVVRCKAFSLGNFGAFQRYAYLRSVTSRKMAGHGKGREAGKNKRTKKNN